jgi:hypothetical protein
VLCAVYVWAFARSPLHTGDVGSLWRHALVRVSLALLLYCLGCRILIARCFVLDSVSIYCLFGAIFPMPSHPDTIPALCGIIHTSALGVATCYRPV